MTHWGVGPNPITEMIKSTYDGEGVPPLTLTLGFRLTLVWMQFWQSLPTTFAFSYFWTTVTVIYFLLRKSEDSIGLDQVYIPAGEPVDDTLPLVGIPAADHREARLNSQPEPKPEASPESVPAPGA